MKTRLLVASFTLLLLLGVSASAQQQPMIVSGDQGNLETLAQQLARESDRAVNDIYQDFTRSRRTSRTDVETVYLAQQFSASAELFKRMVQDRSRTDDLRESVRLMQDLLNRADRGAASRFRIGESRRTLNDISRELNRGGVYGDGGNGGGGGIGGGDDDGGFGRPANGQMRWRGSVDDEVNLIIRDQDVEVRTLGGQEINNATFNFSAPMPRRRVSVSIYKIRGRGDIRVIQQPSRDNNFTTIVSIRDPSRGSSDYEFNLTWQ